MEPRRHLIEIPKIRPDNVRCWDSRPLSNFNP